MHSSTHASARDSGSGWSEPRTAARKAKKRAKKATPKKKAAKKSTAKKTATAKKTSATKRAKDPPGVVGLRREVAALERKVADLGDELARLSAALSGIASRSPHDVSVDEDIVDNPFARWLKDPSIEQYRGEHIALHPALGVVAHADSPDAVVEMVLARGIPLDQIALDFVSSAPW